LLFQIDQIDQIESIHVRKHWDNLRKSQFADDSANWSCAILESRGSKKPRCFRGADPRSRGVESPRNRIGLPTGDLANRGGSRRPGPHREKSLRSLRRNS